MSAHPDVQLAALIYLLARCARGADAAERAMVQQHLELLAGNPRVAALLRNTCMRLLSRAGWGDVGAVPPPAAAPKALH